MERVCTLYYTEPALFPNWRPSVERVYEKVAWWVGALRRRYIATGLSFFPILQMQQLGTGTNLSLLTDST